MNGIKRGREFQRSEKRGHDKNQYLVAGLRVPGDAGVTGLA